LFRGSRRERGRKGKSEIVRKGKERKVKRRKGNCDCEERELERKSEMKV